MQARALSLCTAVATVLLTEVSRQLGRIGTEPVEKCPLVGKLEVADLRNQSESPPWSSGESCIAVLCGDKGTAVALIAGLALVGVAIVSALAVGFSLGARSRKHVPLHEVAPAREATIAEVVPRTLGVASPGARLLRRRPSETSSDGGWAR